ncbi:MAG TPA: hypothetical protein VEG64_14995 [Candidatus Sulfotelmatobacter sp.]|nr:hypothetical protein [Candidatus Sulfotelmatobacter sp.]
MEPDAELAGDRAVEATSEETPDDIPAEIKPKEATSIVWAGSDPQLLLDVKACLTENGIASVVAEEGVEKRVSVRPVDEARAREIIREVLEATPPE